MSEGKKATEVKDADRRKLLKGCVASAAVVASLAGYSLLKLPDGTFATVSVSQSTGRSTIPDPNDPTLDANGIQLPSLTSDPAHRQGSIYFRSDLSQMRLDDGASYYTLSKNQVFSKGGVVQSPVAQTIVIWRAPFACTIRSVKGYQDTGTGSVVTAYDGPTDVLQTDIKISASATWQDGGSIAKPTVSAGDSIAIGIVSVSGSPNYLVVQVEMTQP